MDVGQTMSGGGFLDKEGCWKALLKKRRSKNQVTKLGGGRKVKVIGVSWGWIV